ncbi:MAG: hypothetical protein GY851_33180 [bacterium]|nr:hypothetical protein [bacterium]
MVLGGFVAFIAVPVIIGTLWATTAHARVVNLLAGVVLFGIGAVMAVLGWAKNKRLKQR